MAEKSTISLNRPNPFNPNKNHISEDWRVWKNEFLIYLELADMNSTFSLKKKTYLLLNFMGTEGVKAKNKMTFNNVDDEENIEILLQKFDEMFDPPLNEIEERYKFFSRRKHRQESLDDYIADIKGQALRCNFGDQIEKFITDMIILSMDNNSQQSAFTLNDLSLPNIIQHFYKQLNYDEKTEEIYFGEPINSSSKNINRAGSEIKADLYNVFEKPAIPLTGIVNQNNEATNNSLYERMEASVSKLEDCRWCESKHLLGQCNHADHCKTCVLFPHNICFHCKKNPHGDDCYYKTIVTLPSKNASKAGPLCSKCQTNHVVFARCPAYNATCFNCFDKGHYTSTCKKKNVNEETANLSRHATNKNYEKSTSTINCSWCASRHVQNQCPHDSNCTQCTSFPHNICFNCKQNPHHDACYFEAHVRLPVRKEFRTDTNPSQCKENDSNAQCLAKNQVCTNCFEIGHTHGVCNSRKMSKEEKITKFNKSAEFPSTASTGKPEQKTKRTCGRCGFQHPYNTQCSAHNEKCSSCGQMGHYEWKCRSQPTIRALEDCIVCKLRCLQHINASCYYCYSCCEHYILEPTYDSADVKNRQRSRNRRRRPRQNQPKEEEVSCTIS